MFEIKALPGNDLKALRQRDADNAQNWRSLTRYINERLG
jgi:hypothetical protein